MQRIAEHISKPNDYQPTGDAARRQFGLDPIIGPAMNERIDARIEAMRHDEETGF